MYMTLCNPQDPEQSVNGKEEEASEAAETEVREGPGGLMWLVVPGPQCEMPPPSSIYVCLAYIKSFLFSHFY